MSYSLDRRQFLKGATGAVLAGGGLTSPFSARTVGTGDQNVVSFFAIGDTHYFANEQSPNERQEASVQVCSRLIETLNRLAPVPRFQKRLAVARSAKFAA